MTYQTIYYWPNNCWCYKGEVLPDHMSDDYVTMDVPDNMTYEQIDALVETMNVLENEDGRSEGGIKVRNGLRAATAGKPACQNG